MRTVIDLPEHLLQRTKVIAAQRGSSLKELIVKAIEKEIDSSQVTKPGKRVEFPLVHMPKGKKLKLDGFDFDDLLT